ncbi:MAG: DUF3048 domain-containing protein, partial [Candidatus Jacksonbacteria bacterium]
MSNVKLNSRVIKIVFLAAISFYTTAMLFTAVFNLVKLNKEVNEFKPADIDYSVLINVDKEPECFNLLNGQITEDQEQAKMTALAIMIDNGIGAGKPYGLSQADLLIEAPVEGGITRFLAFFDS